MQRVKGGTMENDKPAKSSLKLPNADNLTLEWLWKAIPVRYWRYLAGFLITVFLAGVYAGQIVWVKDLLPGINRTNQLSGKIISQPPIDAKAPKEPQVNIEQQTKGDQSQNIVTKGNVDIRFDNKEKK